MQKTFGPDGTEATGFGGAGATAVDQEANVVYVLDQAAGTISKFDLEGNPVNFTGSALYLSGNQITGLSVNKNSGESQMAVDSNSGNIYVTGENGQSVQAFQENGEPSLFTAGPGAGTSKITGFSLLMGVAVDVNGFIYISDWGNGKISILEASGAPVTSLEYPAFGPGNVAVAIDGTLYINRLVSNVFKVEPSTFPVTPATTYTELDPVNSANSTTVGTHPTRDEVLIAETSPARISIYNGKDELRASFGGAGEEAEGELDRARGVAVSEDGGVEKIFVSNLPESGLSQVVLFKRERVLEKPTIEATAVDEVTSDSATLRARINPNNLETTYQFEYGLEECGVSACVVVPLDPGEIGEGFEGVIVTEPISGLDPGTTYHYRVVAENELGVETGPERTFSTQGEGLSFDLEDSRVWEMVSPANKHGGAIINTAFGAMQASAAGDGLAYLSRGSLLSNPNGNRSPEESSLLARRVNGIWQSEDLTPPFSNATEITDNGEYNVFSPDLSLGEIEPRDDTPLSPWASERTPYLRDNTSPPVFTPLVTSVEPFANVPPGTKFGPASSTAGTPAVRIQAASEDLSHIVLQSQAPLSVGAAGLSLYMWSGGLLEPVSELPDGEGGATVLGVAGSGPGSTRHAVSEDGTRVFWAPTAGYNAAGISLPALYLRDLEADETIRLDIVQPGGSGAGEPLPAFQGASEDGDVVFFTDSEDLTEDSSPTGRDLYRCEVDVDLGCVELTNLSAPLPGSGESAGVFDQVTALSDDGEQLYFVATGVLDEGANGEGDVAVAGQPNLYIWRESEGLRFVARLSERDYGTWGGAPSRIGYESQLTAAASPSGRYLAFTSDQSLTGYENRNAQGELNAEVFLYDSLTDQLHCVSCSPSGAAAVGEQVPSQPGKAQTMDPGGIWGGRWAAGLLPEFSITEPVSTGNGRTLYRSRSVLDNGRVFFNAADGLVAADSNGSWDVYQYEPIGTGSCVSSSAGAAVARSGEGCIGLLSSGTAAGDSGFLDASASGDDVFFMTRGRLSPWDEDEAFDVYDARVNGVAAVRPPIVECAGASCQSSAQQQEYTAPSSEVFRGSGNQLHCPKGKRKIVRDGKPRCVKKKSSKGKKQRKKAGKNRRAAR
ncbi:MAG TPA: hypothetical protein VFT79_06825 [Solirubrobacterales bacterium]|nr:hypothetical protein [Solirubrobacterales bacterium]